MSFFSRYGYVSSFAYEINQFVKKYKPTKDQVIELLYLALLQVSQVQFHYIMNKTMEEQYANITKKNLMEEYFHICSREKLSNFGGPFSRVQAQPNTYTTDVMAYKENSLFWLKCAIADLDLGKFLTYHGVINNI